MIGQTIENTNPKTNDAAKVTIGINLIPLKKPKTVGNWIFLNLLYKKATIKPMAIPPKTLVDNDLIPTLLVNIEPNCVGFNL
ncbi:hypothetical protein FACS1894166_05580 [Bacilli bacterium]|nr:hypothetical protein FACS1894166_05580 [Bacilli bacterium]